VSLSKIEHYPALSTVEQKQPAGGIGNLRIGARVECSTGKGFQNETA
jgi:hypothetical protein